MSDYLYSDVDLGSLSWPSQIGRLEVRPVIHPATARTPVHATIMVAGHELDLWDARAVAAFLTDLCAALERQE